MVRALVKCGDVEVVVIVIQVSSFRGRQDNGGGRYVVDIAGEDKEGAISSPAPGRNS
jgi:hypothetical protein